MIALYITRTGYYTQVLHDEKESIRNESDDTTLLLVAEGGVKDGNDVGSSILREWKLSSTCVIMLRRRRRRRRSEAKRRSIHPATSSISF